MRLAVSNIAWDAAENAEVLHHLKHLGVEGIEIAPTKVWPGWVGASPRAAQALKQQLSEEGFTCPSLQSILFERPELQLFGNRTSAAAFRAHLAMIAEMARALGAINIVFGSPRNRDRGALSMSEALSRAAKLLGEVGETFAQCGVCLCIEANPPVYGCNFITHWEEAAELVARANSPGIGLHLDVACTVLSEGDPRIAIRTCAALLRHFHISEPNLGPLSSPTIDHASVGATLRASGYEGWVSIEMRRVEHPLNAIVDAVRYAKRCYLDV